jgi:hypothetical protein
LGEVRIVPSDPTVVIRLELTMSIARREEELASAGVGTVEMTPFASRMMVPESPTAMNESEAVESTSRRFAVTRSGEEPVHPVPTVAWHANSSAHSLPELCVT